MSEFEEVILRSDSEGEFPSEIQHVYIGVRDTNDSARSNNSGFNIKNESLVNAETVYSLRAIAGKEADGPRSSKKRNHTESRFDSLKEKAKDIEIYPRVGRNRHFVPDRIPNFLLNAPHHYVHLPNSDFRHKTPFILCDFIRYGNFHGFAKYMHEHSVPDLEYVHQFDGDKNPYGPNNRVVIGVDGLVNLYTILAQSVPDHVTVVEDCMSHIDPQTGAVFVSCRHINSWTRVNLVKDTDAHFDDLVKKLGDVSLDAVDTIHTNSNTVHSVQDLKAALPDTVTNKDLLLDVTRALNEKLEATAVEALLASKGSKEEKSNSYNSGSRGAAGLANILLSATSAKPDAAPEHFVPAVLPQKPVTEYSAAIHTYEWNSDMKMFKVGLFFKNLNITA